ncbi:type ISP restriction/modification enzyme [Scytonema millei]|uniref:site-specific DNA-methyltransferase (adenine-specific) n=1 Tax=Scytonema millei VB511283 TaxID=1245923 RepID=A0A9X5I4Y9_9CYAN|nr:type ISP restriction/modification enzyme [Scytonema millei]NHC35129.1 N-6 DNA methylase [Scytonema millei VB511283]
MSKVLISQYQAERARIIRSEGTFQTDSLRIAFQKLLHEYCKSKDFQLIPELDYQTRIGRIIYPNGTVKDALRLNWGYWNREANNLDREIENKLSQGYPDSNILFEDSQTAVLIQAGTEVMRISMQDGDALEQILNRFLNYVPPEVRDFRAAIETFKQDLPTILNTLRDMLEQQSARNPEFQRAKHQIWEICKESINPEISLLDIREMMVQHILTEDIFINVFNEAQHHQENNIARELQQALNTFLTSSTKNNLLSTIERYYGVIRRNANNIYNHYEKQKFLKAIYENFYQAYNPQVADRLGIFYTPNEVVRFIIESVDNLLERYFRKKLASKNIEILDPATGTGTFITELIEYLPKNKLTYKYKNEIFCNEIAILPYYIANLNVEFTYKQKMGRYEEFKNICFVDTLEHAFFEGKQEDLLSLNIENNERIQRQNNRTISVIIGNPPYHADRNISYTAIDRRVKETYIRNSQARKTKAYDLYTRFLRWASDRLGKNGIIAFVSNNSFIDARTYDGLRKVLVEEFNEIYIINLKGNARTSGDRRHREGGNIFNDKIRVGIAVYFLVRKERSCGCQIYYHALPNYATTEEKNLYLSERKFSEIQFEQIVPDADNNWLGQVDNDFYTLIPLADRETKFSKTQQEVKAVFKLFTLGVITARDEWVYAESETALEQKVRFFIGIYNQAVDNRNARDNFDRTIKWTRRLKRYLNRSIRYQFKTNNIQDCLYRPFVTKKLYFSPGLNEMQYQLGQVFDSNRQNLLIGFTAPGSTKSFMTLASDRIPDYHLIGDSQCLPLYRYDENGNCIDNITDWGLEQFQNHYNEAITKLEIFHYTYAVLHYPAYRTTYQQNLNRDFPRLPFYNNFQQWVNWGQRLIELHINYETVALYPLQRIDLPTRNAMKVKLKADRDRGRIIIDPVTTLEGIPTTAWEYMLGNHSALEWVLEQYKEKKPKDATVAARFYTYRFANYKEQAIALLQRVCTVSVETMRIVREMNS